jgi:hypothetical protein
MSVSLGVKLTKLMYINVVLPEIAEVLQEILGLPFKPSVTAEGFVNRRRMPLRSNIIGQESEMILFEIENEQAVVGVTVYRREADHLPGEEEGVYAAIEVSAWRSPLEYALAASIAAAFGRQCSTPITDYMPFYTKTFRQSANEFIDSIKVLGTFTDYQTAGQVFYDSLIRDKTTQ